MHEWRVRDWKQRQLIRPAVAAVSVGCLYAYGLCLFPLSSPIDLIQIVVAYQPAPITIVHECSCLAGCGEMHVLAHG